MSSAMPCTGQYSRAAASALAELSESAGDRRCATAGHDLRDLAAHRVSDEHDLAQVELLEDGFYIVGELQQTVRAAETGRLTPAPLGERDGVPFGQRADDGVPGPRRSSVVVQEQEGRSRSGATVHGHAPAAHVNADFGT